MRKIGRPYNSAVKVGRGQTVELARVWPAELHPPPTFHLLSLFARLPRAIYTSNNFAVTAQLHVTYQPLFPPFAAEGDSSPCSVNYSIPVKFFSRSIDEGRGTNVSRGNCSLFSLRFFFHVRRPRDQEERDVRSERSISSRKLSLNRNAN